VEDKVAVGCQLLRDDELDDIASVHGEDEDNDEDKDEDDDDDDDDDGSVGGSGAVEGDVKIGWLFVVAGDDELDDVARPTIRNAIFHDMEILT
jgi:hypothetical protein